MVNPNTLLLELSTALQSVINQYMSRHLIMIYMHSTNLVWVDKPAAAMDTQHPFCQIMSI